MPLVSKLSANERDQFLHVMQESLAIERHSQLFLWLQSDLQHFLPHEVLIVLVGDFQANRVKADIISALPGAGKIHKFTGSDLQPIANAMFERWHGNGRRILTVNGQVSDLLNIPASCVPGDSVPATQSVLIHGLRDERSGEDALYIVLRSGRSFDDQQRRMFAMLMPHIDHACRRVTALAAGRACPAAITQPQPVVGTPANDSGLSAREMEILDWVRAGKTNHEIGLILGISPFTVKNHLQRIFRKIDVLNRTQAIAKVEDYRRAAK